MLAIYGGGERVGADSDERALIYVIIVRGRCATPISMFYRVKRIFLKEKQLLSSILQLLPLVLQLSIFPHLTDNF